MEGDEREPLLDAVADSPRRHCRTLQRYNGHLTVGGRLRRAFEKFKQKIFTKLRCNHRSCCGLCFYSCCDFFVSLSKDERMALDDLKRRVAVEFDALNPLHETMIQKYRECSINAAKEYYFNVQSPSTAFTLGGTERSGSEALNRTALPESFSDPKMFDWIRLGFQSRNPRTDFRGGGLSALKAMLYFAQNFPLNHGEIFWDASTALGVDAGQPRGFLADFPFAAAFINISFLLVVYFRLNLKIAKVNPSGPEGFESLSKIFNRLASKRARRCLAEIYLQSPDNAFEELFSMCCISLHQCWKSDVLARGAQHGAFSLHKAFALRLAELQVKLVNLFEDSRPLSVYDFHLLTRMDIRECNFSHFGINQKLLKFEDYQHECCDDNGVVIPPLHSGTTATTTAAA